ncbi:unnamed protein product [Rhodiola kirilowii]
MGKQEANPSSRPSSTYPVKEEKSKLWGILLFGIIGATATTLAVGQLKKSREWFHHVPFTRSGTAAKGTGTGSGSTYRTASQEEAWKRYNRRMQEEYEDEMERVERIRRMQSVFNRERSKHQKRYETWTENQQNAYTQDFQRHDWYWKAENNFKDHNRTNYRETPRSNASNPLSHHYTVLGLDRTRTERYTDSEIKKAFRAKALQFHPDQNQGNTEAAEAKFKEVMVSYEAIKKERKDMK